MIFSPFCSAVKRNDSALPHPASVPHFLPGVPQSLPGAGKEDPVRAVINTPVLTLRLLQR